MRRRQAKNFAALLLLANGVPMFRMGDEFLHTQQGNNNAYNQDNEISWLDWERLDEFADVHRFFRKMIAFRRAHRSIGRSTYWRDDVAWHRVGPEPDLADRSHSVAYLLSGVSEGDDDLSVMINGWWEPLTFEDQGESEWKRVIDTALPSPDDIAEDLIGEPISTHEYQVDPRSVVVLVRERS